MDSGRTPVMGLTHVMRVEGAEVVIAAGRMDGLAMASTVSLLREGEPIAHPLTGEVLGVPHEPVGTLEVFELGDHQARGRLIKTYSVPMVEDQAEFEPVLDHPSPAMEPAASEVMTRMDELHSQMEEYRKRSEEGIKGYPAYARRVMDEISVMRSHVVSIDERLQGLEQQRLEDHYQLSDLIGGALQRDGMKEFTIKYLPDTQVRLRVAGKTLMIDVIADTLQAHELMDEPVAMMKAEEADDEGPGLLDMFSRLGESDDEEAMADDVGVMQDDTMVEPWYKSIYYLVTGIGLILVLVTVVVLIIHRRYNEVMEGLDEFEDFDDEYEGYLEDDDDKA
ncbi:MAG: hypothetical protein VX733_12640 [Candidatus Latescibacterota bacterium]|nr:hypothetical protein [Candidatus Latescibacterota bacterium]